MATMGLTKIATAGIASVAGSLVLAASAQALQIAANIPATGSQVVTVGQSVTGAVDIRNEDVVNPVNVTSARLNPSCKITNLTCEMPVGVSQFDPGVVSLGSGTGAETGCAGTSFTLGPPDANGFQTFTPVGGPVMLAMGNGSFGGPDTCTINFPVDVLMLPSTDGNGAVAGIQTNKILHVDHGVANVTSSSSYYTVNPAPPPVLNPAGNPPGASPKSPCAGLRGRKLALCLCKNKKSKKKQRKCKQRIKGKAKGQRY